MFGMVLRDLELADSPYAISKANPKVGVSPPPYPFRDHTDFILLWSRFLVVEASSSFGSEMNRRWRIYISGYLESGCMRVASLYRESGHLPGAYREAGINAQPDEHGAIRIIPRDSLVCLIVMVGGKFGSRYGISARSTQLETSEIWSVNRTGLGILTSTKK